MERRLALAEVRPPPTRGMNDDVPEAGLFGVQADAGGRVEQPLAAGAERIVVERVHAGILEAAFRGPAVPALPDRRGPVLHREEPRGEGVLHQQPIGRIDLAGLGEHGQQIADAHETGRKVPALGPDVLLQILGRLGPQFLGQEIELQGHGVTALGVAGDAAVGLHVTLVEGGLDLAEELFVLGRLGLVADGLVRAGHEARRVGEIGRADQVLGRVRRRSRASRHSRCRGPCRG